MEILIVLFTSLLFIYSVATTTDEEVAELLKSGENQKVIKLLERLTGDERQAGDRLINLARSYALEGDLVRSEHVLRENLFVHSTSLAMPLKLMYGFPNRMVRRYYSRL